MTDTMERLNRALAGRYRLERELGRGGVAVVYLARDLKHDRQVAFKVVEPELAQLLWRELFLAELKITAQLNHPHILPLYDSGEADDLLFYVVPYVAVESLRDRLTREKQLPVDDALRIGEEVAAALGHAHSHGVVHRDIKPENILLSNGEAVVADLGIAHAIAEAGGQRLTASGVTVGTPAYMSPEQASGESAFNGRSDLYALGCVVYEMLAGEPPLTGGTAQATAARRMSETPSSLRIVREMVSDLVEQAVMKALAKVPEDRFSTAHEFAEVLRAAREAPVRISRVSDLWQPEAQRRSSTGETDSPVLEVEQSGRRFNPWMALLAFGLIAAAFGTATLLLRSQDDGKLDPDLVVVAPFDVLDPALALWREGMVDVLTASLDGAGRLRVTPPSMALKRWTGPSDRASASQLGKHVGAGLAVYGRVLGAGDSLRIFAFLLDVKTNQAIADISLRGSAEQMDRLADSLALRVMAQLRTSRALGATQRTSLGSSSSEALTAFLQGEQYLRRLRPDSARSSYARAVEHDSGFALAYDRLGMVTWGEGGGANAPLFLKAGSLNRGLARRESLLVAADSLFGALAEFVGDSTSWSQLGRLGATLDRALQEYPDAVGAWYRLGEARAHYGAALGVTEPQTLAPFARAVALDSGFVPAYDHLIALEFRLEGLEAGRRTLGAFLAHRPGGVWGDAARLVSAVLEASRVSAPAFDHLVTGFSKAEREQAVFTLWALADSAQSAVRLARAYARSVASTDPDRGRRILTWVLAWRGHLREAYDSVPASRLLAHRRTPDASQAVLFSELALLRAVPPDSAAVVFRSWLKNRDLTVVRDQFLGNINGVYLALPWWGTVGDTVSLARAIRSAESLVQSRSLRVAQRGFVQHTAQAARAYLVLARGDSAAALHEFSQLPRWPCGPCYRDRLTHARLLVAGGDPREAAAILDQVATPGVSRHAGEVIWVLERGRVHESLGDREAAVRAYSFVVDVWRDADPELQPYVAQAREAMRRLGVKRRK